MAGLAAQRRALHGGGYGPQVGHGARVAPHEVAHRGHALALGTSWATPARPCGLGRDGGRQPRPRRRGGGARHPAVAPPTRARAGWRAGMRRADVPPGRRPPSGGDRRPHLPWSPPRPSFHTIMPQGRVGEGGGTTRPYAGPRDRTSRSGAPPARARRRGSARRSHGRRVAARHVRVGSAVRIGARRPELRIPEPAAHGVGRMAIEDARGKFRTRDRGPAPRRCADGPKRGRDRRARPRPDRPGRSPPPSARPEPGASSGSSSRSRTGTMGWEVAGVPGTSPARGLMPTGTARRARVHRIGARGPFPPPIRADPSGNHPC